MKKFMSGFFNSVLFCCRISGDVISVSSTLHNVVCLAGE